MSNPNEGETYAAFQQRRGRLPDLIEETLSIYDGFMKDDDYDAQGCLDKIAERLRSARDFYEPATRPTGDREAIARAACIAMGDDPDREGPFSEWFEESPYAKVADALAALSTEAKDTIDRYASEIIGLREALQTIEDGNEPRSVGKFYFRDKRVNKYNECQHGVWMYETCGNCISDFARLALTEDSRDG